MNNDLSLLQTIPLSVLENTNKCGTNDISQDIYLD